MSKTLKSPNDSLQQSTTFPSTRSGDYSIDTTSFASGSRRLCGGSTQIGGGSYTSYIADHLRRLHKDIEATTGALEREQRRLYKIDKDLIAAESEYSQKRQKYKLFQNSQDDAVQHKIAEVRQLERRLEKAIADLNRLAADNEKLREQIDQLRKERKILNVVFKQLERGIGRSSKTLNELMLRINEDRLASEEAKQQSHALGKMLERERFNFHNDTEELKRMVAEEANVQREQERGQRDRREAPSGRGGKGGRAYMIADEEEAFSETDMYRRILKLSFLNTIQRRHIRQHQKNIEVFEQAFATIKSSTGISDIEEIVKIFIALEQRNFSLLTYVNQLNREIESIEIRNKELQTQLNDHKHQETQSSARRDNALSDIMAQIAQTKAATQEKNATIDDAVAVLAEVRPSVWNIVKFLKKEIPNMVNLAYEGDAPSMKAAPPDEQEENLNNYLMFIEDALLQFRVCLPAEAQRTQPLPNRSQGVRRPTDLPVAHIQGDDSDDDPEGGMSEQMLSRSELRVRAQANISRRRKKPGQPGKHAEGGRVDVADDTSVVLTEGGSARRDPGGPPPPPLTKDHTASSAASQGSGGQDGTASGGGSGGGGVALSKSPSMKDGADEEAAGDRPWRQQGKEKKK